MRTRKLGRLIGRLVAVAAFGAAAILGVTAAASADTESDVSQSRDVATVDSSPGDEMSPNDYVWD